MSGEATLVPVDNSVYLCNRGGFSTVKAEMGELVAECTSVDAKFVPEFGITGALDQVTLPV